MNNFGIRLKETLDSKNLNQKELAVMANTTGATISRYINGERSPNAELLNDISVALNVSTDYLLGKTNEPVPIDEKSLSINEQAGKAIYDKLVEIGFIKNGENITDEHLNVLVDVLAPQLDFALFKLNRIE